MALQRDAQRLNQMSQLQLTTQMEDKLSYGGTLCDFDSSTVLFGAQWSQQLFRLRVTKSHEVYLLEEVKTYTQYNSVAAITSNQRTLIALTMTGPYELSVNELRNSALEPLALLKLDDNFIHFVLWENEHLLAEFTESRKQQVVEIDTTRLHWRAPHNSSPKGPEWKLPRGALTASARFCGTSTRWTFHKRQAAAAVQLPASADSHAIRQPGKNTLFRHVQYST